MPAPPPPLVALVHALERSGARADREALVNEVRRSSLETWVDLEAWAHQQPPARANLVLSALVDVLLGQRIDRPAPPPPPPERESNCVVCGKPTGSPHGAYCSPECAYGDH